MFENIENDVVNLFYGLERGTREDDFNHKDIRITATNEWIDVKQPSKYNTVSGNIAWLVSVVSDTGLPGALFGTEKYIGLTNLFKANSFSETICIDGKNPWLFLLEQQDLFKIIKRDDFNYFKNVYNNQEHINNLNAELSLSPDCGLYFQPCYKLGKSTYFLVITEKFINAWPKQLYCRNK